MKQTFALFIQQLIKQSSHTTEHIMLEEIKRHNSAGRWWKENIKQFSIESSQYPYLKVEKKVNHHQLIMMAYHAPNFSSAFNTAYQFALRLVFPNLNDQELACLCVSEKAGNNPKSIESTLYNNKLTGHKSFVTCTKQLDSLFIMAKTLIKDETSTLSQNKAGKEAKNQNTTEHHTLRIIKISHIQNLIKQQREDFNLSCSALLAKTLPKELTTNSDMEHSTKYNKNNTLNVFMTELEKGQLNLKEFDINIHNAEVFPENAHSYYSKPFSVAEGLCMRIASLSYVLKCAVVFSWPKPLQADIIFQITALSTLVEQSKSPMTQIMIDAQDRMLKQNIQQIEELCKHAPVEFQEHWKNNKLWFFMDVKYREKRLINAWQTLSN